jgi:hypothetical protein
MPEPVETNDDTVIESWDVEFDAEHSGGDAGACAA